MYVDSMNRQLLEKRRSPSGDGSPSREPLEEVQNVQPSKYEEVCGDSSASPSPGVQPSVSMAEFGGAVSPSKTSTVHPSGNHQPTGYKILPSLLSLSQVFLNSLHDDVHTPGRHVYVRRRCTPLA